MGGVFVTDHAIERYRERVDITATYHGARRALLGLLDGAARLFDNGAGSVEYSAIDALGRDVRIVLFEESMRRTVIVTVWVYLSGEAPPEYDEPAEEDALELPPPRSIGMAIAMAENSIPPQRHPDLQRMREALQARDREVAELRRGLERAESAESKHAVGKIKSLELMLQQQRDKAARLKGELSQCRQRLGGLYKLLTQLARHLPPEHARVVDQVVKEGQ